MGKNKGLSNPPKSRLDLIIAKYGMASTALVAFLGLLGTGITAYLGYLGIQTQIEAPIKATQAAESRIILTQRSLPTPTLQPTQTPINTSFYDDYTIVYPSCKCNEMKLSQEKILIRLRWSGSTAENAERGADFIKYSVTINGNDIGGLVGNINNYRKKAILVADPIIYGDPGNTWWVYWDIPVGTIDGYWIPIEASLETLSAINTGWDIIPAGLTKSFKVVLHTAIPSPPPNP